MRVSTQTRERLEAKGIEFLVEGTKKPANSCVEDFIREAFMRSKEFYGPVGRDRLAHVVAERFNIPLEEAEDMVQIESMKITLQIIRTPWPGYENKPKRIRLKKRRRNE